MREKMPVGKSQENTGESVEEAAATLAKSIRGSLESYLKGRKLVRVQIRHVEGSKTEGFLKIGTDKADHLLVDFKAISTPRGGLLSLEVGGRKISLRRDNRSA